MTQSPLPDPLPESLVQGTIDGTDIAYETWADRLLPSVIVRDVNDLTNYSIRVEWAGQSVSVTLARFDQWLLQMLAASRAAHRNERNQPPMPSGSIDHCDPATGHHVTPHVGCIMR